jgi:hypothetical protein
MNHDIFGIGKTAHCEMKSSGPRKRFYLVAAIILLIGLGSSVLIYFTAGSQEGRVLGYEMRGGSIYPVIPEDSKKYRHDLEVYGGKANVLADEFIGWFDGLWHGKALAFTVTFIAVFVSLILFIVGSYLPSVQESDLTNGDYFDKKKDDDFSASL